jgi:uncharacterized protein
LIEFDVFGRSMNKLGIMISVFLYFLTLLFFYYLIYPRILMGPAIFYSTSFLFAALFTAYASGLYLMVSGRALNRVNISPLYRYYVFPVTTFYSGLVNRNKLSVWEGFIKMNNSIVEKSRLNSNPDELLVLLPHCLQSTKCSIRITTDIKNCKECGICEIGGLKNLLDEYGVKGFVVTGGTLARRIAKEKLPKGIVAVACHHDLAEGISLVYPIPVYGVLNDRPEGPCLNTHVDLKKIRAGIEVFLK